jgi:hypothetical protein
MKISIYAVMSIGLIGILIFSFCALTPAHAAKAADYRLVSRACVSEVARFCPTAEQDAAASHAQAICLKPYLSSLSFNCRRAVKAVHQ